MINPEIRFIKNIDIDRVKWDQCIANSPFGIAYAYSWFLDRICTNWDALIWGDYLYIMPLVNSKKYGIRYIYQPFFTQQLGIYSSFPPEPEIVNHFLLAIPKRFRLVEMNLNLGNTPTVDNYAIKANTTYELNLNFGIDHVRNYYNSNTRRNIQKANHNKISVSQIYDVPQFIEFTKSNLLLKSPEVKEIHYEALKKVVGYSIYTQLGEIYGAWDERNNLVAAVFFITSNRKTIYLAASSSKIGIEQSAMFLLIDTFIGNNAGKKLTLDFEGSNIPGVARFYSGFGAMPESYFSVYKNELPGLLRIFKK